MGEFQASRADRRALRDGSPGRLPFLNTLQEVGKTGKCAYLTLREEKKGRKKESLTDPSISYHTMFVIMPFHQPVFFLFSVQYGLIP